MSYIKCYHQLCLNNNKYLNEEETPCDQCLNLLKCYDLEKLVKKVNRIKKKLKKGETETMKLVIKNNYLGTVVVSKGE